MGLLSQFPPFRYFPIFSELSKHTLDIKYHVYIWQVSPQLSCGDTCQIWIWFKESNGYYCKGEHFAYGEINERSFSNPHPCDVIFIIDCTGSRQFDNFQCNRGDENFVKMTLPFQWSSDFHDVFCIADNLAPVVICPSELVTVYYDSNDTEVEAIFPELNAADNIGVVRQEYSPQNGTMVTMRYEVEVTVRAWDAAGNVGFCKFTYVALRKLYNISQWMTRLFVLIG